MKVSDKISIEIKILPKFLNDQDYIYKKIKSKVKIKNLKKYKITLKKRSIDARKRPMYLLRYLLSPLKDEEIKFTPNFTNVKSSPPIIIVGAGPAGYFAALECLRNNLKPIILERGVDVRARRRDLKLIQQEGIVNPNSNYCFGEGGAGTYSDGKLYTRSHKRGKINDVLKLLVHHGANEDILIDAHPHIGSNKLPKIISNIRSTIEEFGGKVFFNHLVTDIHQSKGIFKSVTTHRKQEFTGKALILATGHSSREIYYLFHKKKWHIEAKPFALGIRIEHPQRIIDKIQYNQPNREENLPASSYKLVSQVYDKGVFSFCMCPGGLIVPSATYPGEVVVNGMSLSGRNSSFANSGIVTEISLEELSKHGYTDKFAALDFQREIEKSIFDFGDGSQKAPAQRMMDFINQKKSETLNRTSYIPGLYSAPLHDLLPSFVYKRLSKGLQNFGSKLKGYLTNEANIVAIESRTSSPIKIVRNENMMFPQIKHLYPCGEGAGYAGGILSAAMDGQNAIKALVQNLT